MQIKLNDQTAEVEFPSWFIELLRPADVASKVYLRPKANIAFKVLHTDRYNGEIQEYGGKAEVVVSEGKKASLGITTEAKTIYNAFATPEFSTEFGIAKVAVSTKGHVITLHVELAEEVTEPVTVTVNWLVKGTDKK